MNSQSFHSVARHELPPAVQAFNDDVFGPKMPWYDSAWLQVFAMVRGYLREKHPDRVREFEDLLVPLRTSAEFETIRLPGFIDDETLHMLRAEIEVVVQQPMSEYERTSFGRNLLHDRHAFTDLAVRLAGQVSELVGEPVEPYYNFLSLYGPNGKCEPHMDAPEAKWTLDICIAQSERWPLHVSPVVAWPSDWDGTHNHHWQEHIRSSQPFTTVTMDPSDATVFAGSTQWHYRDPFPRNAAHDEGFCQLLFLHYIPKGCAQIINPRNWGGLLDLPQLGRLIKSYSSHYGSHTSS